MEVYEKDYKGLVLFLACMFAAMLGLGIPFALRYPEHSARFTINICTLSVTVLMLLIRRSEKIYWINTVDFESAKNAGSERRRAFALRYLKRFAWVSAGALVLSVSFALLGVNQMVDFSLITVALCVTAISTVWIKL